MMGPRQVAQGALFYEFSLEAHVPADHLLRDIDRFVELSGVRRDLAPFYSAIGRPSIDPELMIRMLHVGYVMGIRAVRQAENGAAKTMIGRTMDRFGLYPERLIADTAYGTATMLGWLVEKRGIEPHIPVFDKSRRTDGTFSREDFAYDHRKDAYTCPAGKQLKQYRRAFRAPRTGVDEDGLMRYRARKADCEVCPLKPRCCPKEPQRKVLRSIHEGARQMARDITATEEYGLSAKLRKKVEMLFAHLKRILGLSRLRLRGPCGARDEFLLAATAQTRDPASQTSAPEFDILPIGQVEGLFAVRAKLSMTWRSTMRGEPPSITTCTMPAALSR